MEQARIRPGIKVLAAKRWSSEYGSLIRRRSMAAAVFLVLATEVLCLVLYKAGLNDYELPYQHTAAMPRRAANQPRLRTTVSTGATQPTTFSPPLGVEFNSQILESGNQEKSPKTTEDAAPTTNARPYAPSNPQKANVEDELSRLLRRTSMESQTVILTTINEAWAKPNSTFDLMLKSFQGGYNTSWLLKHLVVIAFDRKAYKWCKKLHNHCYFLKSQATNFSGEAFFMSPNYLEMVWRKIDFLGKVLQLGYNFVFTDADIMWFRDPFPQFHSDADIQVACDIFNGNSLDVNNLSNTGLQYAISNNRTIQFYKFWYDSRKKYSGIHDQDAFDKIKNDSFVKDIGLKMRFLDTAYFGGFCELSKDLNKVCTVHANCCLGLNNKLHDLNVLLGDWKRYMLLSPSQNTSNLPHWTVPQKCHI
ncbi:hypothetical protein Ancab_012735 [Ancistrocladus abbreviatus]